LFFVVVVVFFKQISCLAVSIISLN
jgi:hypothetical protein